MKTISTPLVRDYQRYSVLFSSALVLGAALCVTAFSSLFFVTEETESLPFWYYAAVVVAVATFGSAEYFARKMDKTQKKTAAEIERAILADLGMTVVQPSDLSNLGSNWSKSVMVDRNGSLKAWLFKKDTAAGTVLAKQLSDETTLLL